LILFDHRFLSYFHNIYLCGSGATYLPECISLEYFSIKRIVLSKSINFKSGITESQKRHHINPLFLYFTHNLQKCIYLLSHPPVHVVGILHIGLLSRPVTPLSTFLVQVKLVTFTSLKWVILKWTILWHLTHWYYYVTIASINFQNISSLHNKTPLHSRFSFPPQPKINLGNHQSVFFVPVDLLILYITCKWNHTVYDLLHLASFTWINIFKIHPHHSMYLYFIPYGQ
jgi:hypothetical protein